MEILLRCGLEIILLSFLITRTGFISAKGIRKLAKQNKRNMIEALNNLKIIEETPVQEIISGKKSLSHVRSTNIAKFEDGDKEEYHS